MVTKAKGNPEGQEIHLMQQSKNKVKSSPKYKLRFKKHLYRHLCLLNPTYPSSFSPNLFP